MFYILLAVFVFAILASYITTKIVFKNNREKFHAVIMKLLKIFAVAYCVIIFLTVLLPDGFTISYDKEDLFLSSKTTLYAIVRWFSILSFIMLPIAVFFKNRTIRNIAIYFCTIMCIISACFYNTHIAYFTSQSGRGLNSISVLSTSVKAFLLNPTFRSIFFGFSLGLGFVIPVILAIEEKHVFDYKNYKEYLCFFLVLIFSLLSCIPIYIPQHFFGHTNILFDAWTPPHFIWMALVVIELIVLYFVFRNKDYESKNILCLVLSLSMAFQFFQLFGAMTISMKKMPFQLCNIATFLVLFSIITKNKKLFDFTMIVNVVGAIFALATPDLDGEGLCYLYNIEFICEHTNIIIVPILALLFKLFPRINKNALKNCFIGFAIYFIVIWILGTTLNSIASYTQNDFYNANYFFIFDKDVAIKLLPFLSGVFDITITIGSHIVLYPVVAIAVYGVFNFACLLIYLLIQLIYKIKDKKNKLKTVEN